jgi:hypothetical protein
MQSKSWRGALLASVSLLALGVPMAEEAWQLKGIRYLDMWKNAYSADYLNQPQIPMGMPAYPDAKSL